MFKGDDPKFGHRLGRQRALGLTGVGRLYRDDGPSEVEIERSQGRLRALLGPGADEGIFSEGEDRAAGAAPGARSGEPTKENLKVQERAERPLRPPQVGIVAGREGRGKPGPAPGPRPWEGLGISRRTYFRRKKDGK